MRGLTEPGFTVAPIVGDSTRIAGKTLVTLTSVRVMIAYNVPNRDCGAYSKGGVKDPSTYRRWITGLANGIGVRYPGALRQMRVS